MKLSRQTELAIVTYLTAAFAAVDEDNAPLFPGWATITLYAGHSRADESLTDEQIAAGVESYKLPALVVNVEDSQPHPDLPSETGCRVIRLRCQFQVDSSVSTRAFVDNRLAELWAALVDPLGVAALQTSAHTSTFTIHDVIEANEPSTREGTDWLDEIGIDVVAEPAG